jgi:hypothetical protein
MTKKMWEKEGRRESYDDTIQNYLISTDYTKVIFLGTKYHYVFNDNDTVKQLLHWNGRQKLTMNIHNFEATSVNDVKLIAVIRSSTPKELAEKNIKPLTPNEIEFLTKLGFYTKGTGNNRTLEAGMVLAGTRYLPKPNLNYSTTSSLNKNMRL